MSLQNVSKKNTFNDRIQDMKKKVLISLLSIVAIFLVAGGVFLGRQWKKPLGTSLGLFTPTPSPESGTFTSEPALTQAPSETPLVTETPLPTVTPSATQAQPICGGPPLMYILGIGADNEVNNYLYGLADVIRIARVDFVTPKITVLTIPRDLWVELPGIKEKYAETVTHGKINQAYLYGGPGMGYYEGEGGGPGLLALTLAHNYGLYVDHYGAVNMIAFQKIIDALGGIDIYLDQDWDGRPVDEKTANMGYFEAGQWHMSGNQALRFARIRKKYSDVTRTDNQTLVMCAIKDKALSPSVVTKIPQLIRSLVGEIQTDLTLEQITQLVCVLSKLEKENLQFIRFPDDMLVQGWIYDPLMRDNTFVWDISKEDIQAFIQEFQNDTIPAGSGGGMSCP